MTTPDGTTPDPKIEDPQGLSKAGKAYIEKKLAEVENDKMLKELSDKRLPKIKEFEALREENEKLKNNQKKQLLEQLPEAEQKEYSERSLEELQLLVDYQKKHNPKGTIRGITPPDNTDAANKETAYKLKPGEIGGYNTWKKDKK